MATKRKRAIAAPNLIGTSGSADIRPHKVAGALAPSMSKESKGPKARPVRVTMATARVRPNVA